MTRINLVSPSELTDQHLIAEYREIRLLCANLTRTLNSKHGFRIEKVPLEFKLNKSHVYFFFNKGKYLHNRFNQLRDEMVSRGFNPQNTFPVDIWPEELYNDWVPTERDMNIVRERIEIRIMTKPKWYRYKGRMLHETESGFQSGLPDQTVPVYSGIG